MLATKLSSSSSKLLILLIFSLFINFKSGSVEPADIWKENKKDKKEYIKKENTEEESKINFSKKDKNLGKIKITDSDTNTEKPFQLSGLYDPEKNDLSLSMWSNTDGAEIKKIFKRIEKIKLSSFSEKILIDTIFTYSYPAKSNLSED